MRLYGLCALPPGMAAPVLASPTAAQLYGHGTTAATRQHGYMACGAPGGAARSECVTEPENRERRDIRRADAHENGERANDAMHDDLSIEGSRERATDQVTRSNATSRTCDWSEHSREGVRDGSVQVTHRAVRLTRWRSCDVRSDVRVVDLRGALRFRGALARLERLDERLCVEVLAGRARLVPRANGCNFDAVRIERPTDVLHVAWERRAEERTNALAVDLTIRFTCERLCEIVRCDRRLLRCHLYLLSGVHKRTNKRQTSRNGDASLKAAVCDRSFVVRTHSMNDRTFNVKSEWDVLSIDNARTHVCNADNVCRTDNVVTHDNMRGRPPRVYGHGAYAETVAKIAPVVYFSSFSDSPTYSSSYPRRKELTWPVQLPTTI